MKNASFFSEETRFRKGEEFVISASTLSCLSDQHNLRIVDVRSPTQCPDGHIPGAIQLDVNQFFNDDPKGLGIPSIAEIAAALGEKGLSADDFIVAYDDDSGVDAARLLWTLDIMGHKKYALLNGGFAAWDDEEFELVDEPSVLAPVEYIAPKGFGSSLSDIHAVNNAIDQKGIAIVDNRSLNEFNGVDNRATKVGHIPNAIHYDWENAVDRIAGGALMSPEQILSDLAKLGIEPDQPVILYCQSNRRSSHTFVVLKWLGFTNVSAYPGAWQQWGNSDWTPVEGS